MNTITLSCKDWRAVIDVLREKALPCMREHADIIERVIDRHAPDEPMVTLFRRIKLAPHAIVVVIQKHPVITLEFWGYGR